VTKKNQYPGGVKLTAKTARAIAIQEFGTAKGLEKEEPAPFGYFIMRLGNLHIRIHPDAYNETGCIVVSAEMNYGRGQTLTLLDTETLKENFDAQERFIERERAEEFKDWVLTNGPEFCNGRVNRVWEQG